MMKLYAVRKKGPVKFGEPLYWQWDRRCWLIGLGREVLLHYEPTLEGFPQFEGCEVVAFTLVEEGK